MPDISIDFRLLEESRVLAVVACDIGWSDTDFWAASGDLVEAGARDTHAAGEALLRDFANR